MKRFTIFMVVVAILASITACDILGDLIGSIPEDILDMLNLSYGTASLHISRIGVEPTGPIPINWHVEAWATLTVGLDDPTGQSNGVVYGTGRGLAWFDFNGHGCSGYGVWPVTIQVYGFFDTYPSCTIDVELVETWIGGSVSSAICAGGAEGSEVNSTLGYTFGNLNLNPGNLYMMDSPGAGEPLPGTAGDAFPGWTWQNHWEIVSIFLPEETLCDINLGYSDFHD